MHLHQPLLLSRCPLMSQSPFNASLSPFSNALLFLTLFTHPHTLIQHTSTPPHCPSALFHSRLTFHGRPLRTPHHPLPPSHRHLTLSHHYLMPHHRPLTHSHCHSTHLYRLLAPLHQTLMHLHHF